MTFKWPMNFPVVCYSHRIEPLVPDFIGCTHADMVNNTVLVFGLWMTPRVILLNLGLLFHKPAVLELRLSCTTSRPSTWTASWTSQAASQGVAAKMSRRQVHTHSRSGVHATITCIEYQSRTKPNQIMHIAHVSYPVAIKKTRPSARYCTLYIVQCTMYTVHNSLV